MKSIIIVLFALSAANCMAQLQQPEVKLQNPGNLFLATKLHQSQLVELQGDINDSIEQIVVAVSSVLKSSTEETLEQYEGLYDDIDDIYAPLLVGFNGLNPSDCRNTAERTLNDTTEFAGFEASICAASYDVQVQKRVAAANKALASVDGVYNQVQMIVVKSFSGQNAFTAPEEIEDKIVEILALVRERWATSKPELESVKSSLASDIAEQNKKLGECNVQISDDVASLSGRFQRMVQTCITFDSTSKVKSFDALFGDDDSADYEQQHYDFQDELSKLKSYKWTE